MKYILILYIAWGSAPITPESHVITTAEFDDLLACQAVIDDFKAGSRNSRVQGRCFPKSSNPSPPKPQG
jgi:hypothetical protein